MILLALLVQLPHYEDLPAPSAPRVAVCRRAYEGLDSFVAHFNSIVWDRTLDRGGKLSWNDASDIRNAATQTARPYLDGIREIAWAGRAEQCRRIAAQGRRKVVDRVIRPTMGRR